MHRQRGDAACHGEGFGHARAHEQRARQARAGSVGHRIDIGRAQARLGERLLEQHGQAADVIARGELGHHATIRGVQVDLRVQPVREQAGIGVVDRDAGFITGGFDAEDFHGGAEL